MKADILNQKISQVKDAVGIYFKPHEYSKTELVRAQVAINSIIGWARVTNDPDLMEACYIVAETYKWENGYAQEPKGIVLEQLQNIDESIPRLIEKMRQEKSHPVTGDTNSKEASKALFKVTMK